MTYETIQISRAGEVATLTLNRPAGMSFALAADARIASEHAKFVQAFISIGLVPDTGSSFFLPRLIGDEAAFDLCVSGRTVSAEEALRLRLVSKVVSSAVLQAAAM